MLAFLPTELLRGMSLLYFQWIKSSSSPLFVESADPLEFFRRYHCLWCFLSCIDSRAEGSRRGVGGEVSDNKLMNGWAGKQAKSKNVELANV